MAEFDDRELEQIRKTFKSFDENGDGTISRDELQNALNSMGFTPTEKQLQKMITDVDHDNTGTLDFEEFKELTQTSMFLSYTTVFTVREIKHIKRMFDSYDESGDGELSREELKSAMRKLGQKPTKVQLDEMMATADKDNTGSVDFLEFLDMMSTSETMKLATTHRVKRHGGLVDFMIKHTNDQLGLGFDSTESSASTSSSSDSESEEEGGCTNNIKTLAITAFLFALITALQTVGALFVGSKALMADCVSMGVDSCTYVANIFVECQKGTRWYKPSELIVGSVSLAILSYLTWDVMREAIETLQNSGDGDEEEENPWMPWMVLFFAVFGLLFDSVSLYFFLGEPDEDGKSANMLTALLHVGADFLRSSTTFISSLLMFAGFDTAKVDSVAAIILGVTILGGAAYAAFELIVEAQKYFFATAEKDPRDIRAATKEKLLAS